MNTLLIISIVAIFIVKVVLPKIKIEINKSNRDLSENGKYTYDSKEDNIQSQSSISQTNRYEEIIQDKSNHSSVAGQTDDETSNIMKDFDIKKAVIYKEILDPKYKEY